MPPSKRPADTLRDLAAPRELVEWVRKMPPEEATRRAWIDVTRAEWLPYLAVLRGIPHDAIVRAACEVTLERAAGSLGGTEGQRIAEILRGGRAVVVTAEDTLEDLRRVIMAHGDRPDPPAWTPWCKLVLELGRATRRGNPLIGVALALRMLVGQGGRRGNTDLIARFRDNLVLGG
jgi:hypothetical protein